LIIFLDCFSFNFSHQMKETNHAASPPRGAISGCVLAYL
jgi:hypothetical protein